MNGKPDVHTREAAHAPSLASFRWAKPVAAGIASLGLCVAILIWATKLWRADFTVPFGGGAYNFRVAGEDADFYRMIVKSVVDNGWCLRNPYLGMPYGAQLYDFPSGDNLDVLIMKLLSIFTSNYAVILNLFFLATFPLASLASLFVLRNFRVSYPSAIVAGELFAFMPYHFLRGEGHIFHSAYYMVPPAVMVTLWVWAGNARRRQSGQSRESWTWSRRRFTGAIAISLLVGSWNAYFACFAAFLLCVAGIGAAVRTKTWRPLLGALALLGLIVVAFLANDSPTIAYNWMHGTNSKAITREANEADYYGLRIAQLVLPVTGHRVAYLARLKRFYNGTSVNPINENDAASLGLVATCGFLFLVARLLWAAEGRSDDLLRPLAVLSLSAVLLATTGGFGSVFNYLVNAQIRAYNRISIYIAFFSLFAVALLLDDLRARLERFRLGTWLWYGSLATVLCLGILDQTTPQFVPPYDQLKAKDLNDAEFVSGIEAALQPGAMIFQLPYAPFPERGPVSEMQGWDLLKGYLHSKNLRWSYGAMLGREEAGWANRFLGKPLEQVIQALAWAGFSGIYIDRYGYADDASRLESELSKLLNQQPRLSGDGRLSFFDLRGFAESLRARYTPEQWRERQAEALRLPAPQETLLQ